MKIPYEYSDSSLTVKVELKNAADVFLVDQVNYNNYKAGRKFTYYGGHYTRNPVTITVNKTGRFYLIVRGSDYRYSFFK